MVAAKLACPKCRRTVPEAFWQGVDLVRCPACESEFEQLRFPAMAAARRVERAASLQDGEANCYFHAQNRAEIACDGCGRYVCAVCRVAVAGRNFCPSCLETRTDRRKLPENHRVLYDHSALLMALVPVLFWPLTILSAPAAIILALYGWNRPGSLLGRASRVRLVLAFVIASVQVAAWCYVIGNAILN
jgi:hypothetical protein